MPLTLEPEGNGYFSALVPGVKAGTRYAFQLDGEDQHWVKPASRFQPEGIWAAAAEHLPGPREIGITVIEMRPVADFFGRFGWGYDGFSLFSPARLYGRPDDLRPFIERAYGLGIG